MLLGPSAAGLMLDLDWTRIGLPSKICRTSPRLTSSGSTGPLMDLDLIFIALFSHFCCASIGPQGFIKATCLMVG